MVIIFVPLLANVRVQRVYFLLLAKTQKLRCSTTACVCEGLGPYPFMLNTPPRVVLSDFRTLGRTKGERAGQPIKKYAYTRLLISRRPFKVSDCGGGAIY